jgi:Post-segregation antitoxin CcdA
MMSDQSGERTNGLLMTPEGHPRSLVRAEREWQWLQDNREAISQYNCRIAEHGVLSDDAGLL